MKSKLKTQDINANEALEIAEYLQQQITENLQQLS